MAHREILKRVGNEIIPKLHSGIHKGEAGRILVIGGSLEYSGAPYYAAISALKVGCDLSHVICPPDAAPAIKSYSPELIVYPLLTFDVSCVQKIEPILQRIHSVVLGPGLGRDPQLSPVVNAVIKIVRERKIPLIIDADGLHYMKDDCSPIKNDYLTILTPNIIEFERLCNKYGKSAEELPKLERVKYLAENLGVGIILKGEKDVICFGNKVLECDVQGSLRRCGGQGDLLSGAMATFAAWAFDPMDSKEQFEQKMSVASYGACALTRECSKRAYGDLGRSMTTVEMIHTIPQSFKCLFQETHAIPWYENMQLPQFILAASFGAIFYCILQHFCM